MNFKKNRGFTLIELLVVIAIIGILSSVVLASLNTARDKGRDASLQSSMQTIRVQAELYYEDSGAQYDSGGNDANVCTTLTSMWVEDATIAAALVQINTASAGAPTCIIDTANGLGAQAWAISAPLRDPGAAGQEWCVDSTGVAGEIAGAQPVDDATCTVL